MYPPPPPGAGYRMSREHPQANAVLNKVQCRKACNGLSKSQSAGLPVYKYEGPPLFNRLLWHPATRPLLRPSRRKMPSDWRPTVGLKREGM